MFKRVTLFRVFNFPVKADASWIFLSILIFWTLANNFFPVKYFGQEPEVYQVMAGLTLVGIIISIIAHEVAHAIIAEYYHMPIESITLFIFGGVAEMKGEPSHPKGEFLMALAGPAMSFIMALFFWACEGLYVMQFGTEPASQVLDYLGMLNMVIAIFNMVPAFPLDGGRALRAAIWWYKDNLVLATRIASSLGANFAYLLLGYAIYKICWYNQMVQGMWYGLFGYFVYGAGLYAVRQTESRSLLNLEKVTRFMHSQIIAVSPDLTIAELVDGYFYKHYQKLFPVVDKDRLVGIVTLQGVLAIDRHKWGFLHVASVMEKVNDENTVDPDSSAADALDLMRKLGKDSLLVAREGQFMGVLAIRDLYAYLSITMKMDRDRPVVTSRGAGR
ncbi:MAG TPA: site-2 protease family protein [Patescibacteria group bacterium]|nr:site-2 protease family protein [Patescibacteria group bacterium]